MGKNNLFYNKTWEYYSDTKPYGWNKEEQAMIQNYSIDNEYKILNAGLDQNKNELLQLLMNQYGEDRIFDIKKSKLWRPSSWVSNIPPPMILRLQYLMSSMDKNGDKTTNYNSPNWDTTTSSFYLSKKNKSEYNEDDVVTLDGGATKAINSSILYLKENYLWSDVLLLWPSYFQFYLNNTEWKLNIKTIINESVNKKSKWSVKIIPSMDEIKRSITKNTSAIIVTQPGNPSADFYSISEIKEILTLAKTYDCKIIEDLSFEELVKDEFLGKFKTFSELAKTMDCEKSVISIRSFSKWRNARWWSIWQISSKNRKFIDYIRQTSQSQIDSPSNINADVISLDNIMKTIELEYGYDNQKLWWIIKNVLEEIKEFGIKDIEQKVSIPINENTFLSYIYWKKNLKWLMKESNVTLENMFKKGTTPFDTLDGENWKTWAYFNRFLKIKNELVPQYLSYLDFAKKIFKKTWAEIEWGPNYYDYNKEDEIKKEQWAWMRLSITWDSNYTKKIIEEIQKWLIELL